MDDLHPNFRVWFYSDTRAGVFGDGKVRLLKEIARAGSLIEASKALGISYRKAWGDLRKAEFCLNRKLMERIRGGKGGGRTTLTAEGERILEAYERFRASVESRVQEAFSEMRSKMPTRQPTTRG